MRWQNYDSENEISFPNMTRSHHDKQKKWEMWALSLAGICSTVCALLRKALYTEIDWHHLFPLCISTDKLRHKPNVTGVEIVLQYSSDAKTCKIKMNEQSYPEFTAC